MKRLLPVDGAAERRLLIQCLTCLSLQARIRKLNLIAISAVLVAVDTTAFGYSLASRGSEESLSFFLRILFDVYIVILTALTIQDVEVRHHWVTIVHLSALSALAFMLSFVASILPETDDIQVSLVEDSEDSRLLVGLWYTDLILALLFMTVSSTTPRGPRLHFPSEEIYAEKTLETSTTHAYDNVCGISGKHRSLVMW